MRAHLVLMSLLSLCHYSFSQGCDRVLYENVDFPGTDITFLYSPDKEHCQNLCTQHPSCLFFTFVRADWTQDNRNFYCYIKSTPSGQPNVRTPLLGVTSGFSLKQCSPDLNPCLNQVYHNVDFLGADYQSLFTHDHEECQRVCTEQPGCQFFTYVNDVFTNTKIRHKCHLKFSWNIPSTPIVEKKVGLISGFSHQAKMTRFFDTECQGKLFPNTDIPGSDLRTTPSVSAEHCQALCSAFPVCNYFSYVSDSLTCHLKSNPIEMVTTAKDGVTSGLPARLCQLDSSWIKNSFEEKDLRGSDIRYELMDSAKECQKTCTLDHNCQFYTYVTESFSESSYWRRCYLKRSITIPAPPKVTKLSNVVSGFSLRGCSSLASPQV